MHSMSDAPVEFANFEHRGDTEFMEVFADPSEQLLLAVRKKHAPLPPEHVLRAHCELLTFGPQAQRWSLLIDTRNTTGNNDPRFEAAIARVNEVLLAHFKCFGVLVRSHIGRLHATRLSAVDERAFVSNDPGELLAKLLE